MKHAVVAIGLLLLASALLLRPSCSANAGRFTALGAKRSDTVRRLPTFHLGIVSAPNTYVHEFRWTNDTSNVLTVDAATAGCGCTEVTTDCTTVSPGEDLVFSVVLAPEMERPGPLDADAFIRLTPGPITIVATTAAIVAGMPRFEPPALSATIVGPTEDYSIACELVIPPTWTDPQISIFGEHDPSDLQVTWGDFSVVDSERRYPVRIEGLVSSDVRAMSRTITAVLQQRDMGTFPLNVNLQLRRQPTFVHSPAVVVLLRGAQDASASAIFLNGYSGSMDALTLSCTPPNALQLNLDIASHSVVLTRIQSDATVSIGAEDGYVAHIPVHLR